MTRKLLTALVLTTLLVAFMGTTVFGKAYWDKREKVTNVKTKLDQYNLPEPVAQDHSLNPRALVQEPVHSGVRSSLGSAVATPGVGPGVVVDNTYEDNQEIKTQRRVDFNPDAATPLVHFVYDEVSDPANNRKMGTNQWDPVGNSWPNSAEIGCFEPSQTEFFARWGEIAVLPSGQAMYGAVGGEAQVTESIDGYSQRNLSPTSCIFQKHSVPTATYEPLFQCTPLWLGNYDLKVQLVGADTIVHIVAGEVTQDDATACPYNGNTSIIKTSILYFNKVGTNIATAWGNGQIIDTVNGGAQCLVVSPFKHQVAVLFDDINATGLANLFTDRDFYYREYDSATSQWSARLDISDFDRTEESWHSYGSIQGVYDESGTLHVVMLAEPLPANPIYDSWVDGGDFWDFTTQVLYWNDGRTAGDLTLVANGDYGHFVNNRHCGFATLARGYIESPYISLCDGNLYVTWEQIHRDILGADSTEAGVTTGLDCGTGMDREHAANAEIYLSVSEDLNGNLWDGARNLTETETIDCDGTAGNECGHEWLHSLGSYGFDETGYGFSWPAGVVVDPTPAGEPAYAGNAYMNLHYIADEFSGSWWDDEALSPTPTYNAVKWMRIPCVDPFLRPEIAVEPLAINYPTNGDNGVQVDFTVWVYNTGSAEMTGITVVQSEDDPASDWMEAPGSLANIAYGDSASFTLSLNKSGIIDNGPSGSQFLNGSLTINSDAINQPSLVIPIQFLVADELADLYIDTVTTVDPFDDAGQATYEYVGLTFNNIGGAGDQGIGGFNMDYTLAGNECDTLQTVYLYDGGLFMFHDDGAEMHFNTGLFQGSFVSNESFKPLLDEAPASGATAEYDSVFTGLFANYDTSVTVATTYYAPRDLAPGANFVVVKHELNNPKGTVNNLSIGRTADFDIPSGIGDASLSSADNTAGASSGALVVYQRGTDTAGYDGSGCQDNTDRYGCEVYLGGYTDSEYAGDIYANDPTFTAMWATPFHDWYDSTLTNQNYQGLYDTLDSKTGLVTDPSTEDLAIFSTYFWDYSMTEPVTFYTAYVTIKEGTSTDLVDAVAAARLWYTTIIRDQIGCCIGQRGDIDLDTEGDGSTCTPEEQVADIGDLTNLINHLFISFDPICCPDEADIAPIDTPNPGDVGDGVVDIGDLTSYINYLFITFVPPGAC